MKDPDEETARGMGEGYSLLSVAMTFALTLAGSLVGGAWLDRRLGTTPLFILVGVLFGVGVGGFWTYQKIKPRGKGGASR